MPERNDEVLLREAALEEEGIPELEEEPAGMVMAGGPQEGLIPPRDRPLGAEEFGTTAREEAMGESLDQRIAREEPELSWNDVVAADDDPVAGRLVQPDQGMVDFDATAEEVGDVVPDTVGLSAEEQAVRIETDPDGLGAGWPGYLDED